MNAKVRNNDNIHRSAGLACGLCLFVFFMTDCSNSSIGSGKQQGDVPEFHVKRVEFKDSLKGEDGASYYKTHIDLPVSGPDTLVNNIKSWINQELGGEYEGQIDCDSDMMKQYAQNFFQNEIDFAFPGSGSECSINKVAETDRWISYETDGYVYTGGAHGMQFSRGVTFCKENGKRFAWNLFADSSQIRSQIRDALVAQYFDGNEDDFKNVTQVMVREGEEFPLPNTAPWLLEDSVEFVYQAYEIAPYAAGQPTCRIAIRELAPFFSKEAKEALMKKEK